MGLQYEQPARFFPQCVHIYGEEISNAKNTFVIPTLPKALLLNLFKTATDLWQQKSNL